MSVAWPTGFPLVFFYFAPAFQLCCLAFQGSPTAGQLIVSVRARFSFIMVFIMI